MTLAPLPGTFPLNDATRAELERDFYDTWRQQEAYALIEQVQAQECWQHVLAFLRHHSPHLSRLLERTPHTFAAFINGDHASYCQQIIAEITDRHTEPLSLDEGKRYLRMCKQRLSLMVALVDITERWELEEVTATLSHFADAAAQFALEQVLRQHMPPSQITGTEPVSEHCGITLLGMGKLGGYELNYSSDIDLIALYEPEKLDFLQPAARNQFAVNTLKQVCAYLQERQQEGYVFRVDLRLRPDPASTGLAVSLNNALIYYERVGQNWERAAMIKARHIAGDAQTATRFFEEIRHFIWRTHLDFAAIGDILSIKRQMQAREEPQITLPGHNIKTGYGGIREIEFLAQIYQLIWGGRLPDLRLQPTCAVLDTLAEYEFITPETNKTLKDAYRFYRQIEHRLQMRLDQQTHSLPESEEGLAQLAGFCHEEPEPFAGRLLSELKTVHHIFSDAFHDSPPLGQAGRLVFTGVEHDPDTLDTLRRMGFDDPEIISATIQQWHKGSKRCMRSRRARETLTELVPLILEELSDTVDPDQAFAAFDQFLDALPTGVQPFSLFYANRDLLALIADITGNAPILARLLSQRPQLLDALVGYYGQSGPTETRSLADAVRQRLHLGNTQAGQAKQLIIAKQEQEFLIGVQLLQGDITAFEASKRLSELADLLIHHAIELAYTQLQERYQEAPALHFAVIGLGKLGTQELTIGSDLDVMFVYDIPLDAEGEPPENYSQLSRYYNRLVARIIHLLSQPTKTGPLYELDTRLRPYGTQGAVAVRLDGFRHYYRSNAWMVENLALLQGRLIYASTPMTAPMHRALAESRIIDAPAAEISDNIHDIRRKITRQHYTTNPLDIKYVWGGLMDLQWVVKALLARHIKANRLPESLTSTADHIAWLQEIGAVDSQQHDLLQQAHTLYHIVLSHLRLCYSPDTPPESIRAGLTTLLAYVSGSDDWETLQYELRRLQGQIYHLYYNLSYS